MKKSRLIQFCLFVSFFLLLCLDIVKVGVITPYPVYRNVPVPVKQIVKVPIHIPHPVPVERRVSASPHQNFQKNSRKINFVRFGLNVYLISQVPYAIHVPIERPIPIKIIVPHPYPVEKKASISIFIRFN